ncbi:DoxX family membrane protein [Nocardia puris]|uniref:Putative oxidoreductase n=1 Tax=Nocardia puris TaxID=208602 RepID=A0A366E6I7_9NOCA|nr:DoxX family membrane protein [Nocardia puris]MBF6214659.1 DoxX family membrane protein [Nocardia puris]MBF6368867.1 DoxX family membrane protein [Nocardia puris]MBF6462447.1 DoxX family membrane protein [Nocardia puris]RBO97028.1 putative oxidoreductase [Nocardia puris]
MTTPATTTAPGDIGIDLGLLVLRLGVGLTMAAHGAQKLFGWFDGGGIDGTSRFFGSAGYPASRFFAIVAGVTETFGGLALALGLLTPLAAAAILGTMLNAIAVKWGGGFFLPEGIEYELVLTLAAAGLALTGSGRLGIDGFAGPLRTHRLTYGVGAVLLGVVTAGIVLLIRN